MASPQLKAQATQEPNALSQLDRKASLWLYKTVCMRIPRAVRSGPSAYPATDQQSGLHELLLGDCPWDSQLCDGCWP